ncbi:MAG: hypothetical protein J6R04_04090 [Clostridia bacterium]|nr:hypothetical protein [Clostridia bacterium]
MLERRPALLGLLVGISSHLAVWLAVWGSALLQLGFGLWVAIALLVARLVVFFCLDRTARSHTDKLGQGLRFASTYILPAAVLLFAELAIITSESALAILDPHASMFVGLAYVLMWFAVGIELGLELLLAALTTLFCALRARRASDPTAKY